ncbi:hypothetical protein NXT3_PB00086 (plasmid) [Sinorhizobium fredii]|uniref:Uncharacterized protein n=1 Tax=Rhizobium fredii TaxID=380 RepID=A0A2L0HB67_RHIFR|nr:hypothetical protein NXT3_PB00086 [Sinorhizobium fredii]
MRQTRDKFAELVGRLSPTTHLYIIEQPRHAEALANQRPPMRISQPGRRPLQVAGCLSLIDVKD